MRSLIIISITCGLFACSPDRDRYPPGSSGPTGPGVGRSDPPVDAGQTPDDAGDPTDERFLCGGKVFECEYSDSFANCCDEVFIECPADFPFFCPTNTYCWFEEELCVDNSECTYTGLECEQKTSD